MQRFSTIGIVAKRDAAIADTLTTLIAFLHGRGCEVITDAGCAALLPEQLDACPPEALHGCDLIIVVGGDGTLLHAGRALAARDVPILGINQGRLGFMVDVPPDDLAASMSAVLAGEFHEDQRLMLDAHIERDAQGRHQLLAVNDLVIRNQAAIRMIEFETFLDDAFISTHRADGIIVATPTGSTAYALSGGGPIIHPGVDAVTLVPICPHALSDRPVVVSARHSIRIRLIGDARTRAVCTADGQHNETIRSGDTLCVRRAPRPLRLIHPPSYNYFEVLRSKLHWGRDRV